MEKKNKILNKKSFKIVISTNEYKYNVLLNIYSLICAFILERQWGKKRVSVVDIIEDSHFIE